MTISFILSTLQTYSFLSLSFSLSLSLFFFVTIKLSDISCIFSGYYYKTIRVRPCRFASRIAFYYEINFHRLHKLLLCIADWNRFEKAAVRRTKRSRFIDLTKKKKKKKKIGKEKTVSRVRKLLAMCFDTSCRRSVEFRGKQR